MTVHTSVQLPNQPTGGSLDFHPLGGNGFASPQSVYHGKIESTGDATGGLHQLYVRFDPRYSQLVSELIVGCGGISADVNVNLLIAETSGSHLSVRRLLKNYDIGTLGEDGLVSWSPVPLVISAGADTDSEALPFIRVSKTNVDSETLTMWFHIFNFDKRARELVPIETLTRCLVRTGGSIA